MKRIAYYGGTFDPVHVGHMDVAAGVTRLFDLDDFVFVPAFHAPHKRRSKPTSAFHRFAMLCEASDAITGTRVSTIEVEQPEKPYTIETLGRLKTAHRNERIFFVIGADSWEEITTWRDWEEVLTAVDIVVVTRPGYELRTAHVTDEIRELICDLRGSGRAVGEKRGIFFTDEVFTDVSATRIRAMIRAGNEDWRGQVHPSVEEHIDKYDLYDADGPGALRNRGR